MDAPLALRANRPHFALKSLRSNRSYLTLNSLGALRALITLGPRNALRAHGTYRSLLTLNPLRPLWSDWAYGANGPLSTDRHTVKVVVTDRTTARRGNELVTSGLDAFW